VKSLLQHGQLVLEIETTNLASYLMYVSLPRLSLDFIHAFALAYLMAESFNLIYFNLICFKFKFKANHGHQDYLDLYCLLAHHKKSNLGMRGMWVH